MVTQILSPAQRATLFDPPSESAAIERLYTLGHDDLVEVFRRRRPANRIGYAVQLGYERASTIITSNLPFEDWTQVLASERLTGALLDRLTHHVSILTMSGDSYRLKHPAGRRSARRAEQNQATVSAASDTGSIPPP